MKVIRKVKVELDTDQFKVGDKITINLKKSGTFSATAQLAKDEGTLFMFDSAVAMYQMTNRLSNKGGFKQSELYSWLQTKFLALFPDDIKSRIIEISIPTYSQMFGQDSFYDSFIPIKGHQFVRMKKSKYRIRRYNKALCSYWLQNATADFISPSGFAVVMIDGEANSYIGNSINGVVPTILLK